MILDTAVLPGPNGWIAAVVVSDGDDEKTIETYWPTEDEARAWVERQRTEHEPARAEHDKPEDSP